MYIYIYICVCVYVGGGCGALRFSWVLCFEFVYLFVCFAGVCLISWLFGRLFFLSMCERERVCVFISLFDFVCVFLHSVFLWVCFVRVCVCVLVVVFIITAPFVRLFIVFWACLFLLCEYVGVRVFSLIAVQLFGRWFKRLLFCLFLCDLLVCMLLFVRWLCDCSLSCSVGSLSFWLACLLSFLLSSFSSSSCYCLVLVPCCYSYSWRGCG